MVPAVRGVRARQPARALPTPTAGRARGARCGPRRRRRGGRGGRAHPRTAAAPGRAALDRRPTPDDDAHHARRDCGARRRRRGGRRHAPRHQGPRRQPDLPPASSAKPPKIPAATGTPGGGATGSSGSGEGAGSSSGTGTTGEPTTTSEKHGSSTGTKGSTTGTSTTTTGSTEGAAKSEPPTPILLDTNAASTYNPYEYPATGFGDAALAIDGEPSTAWTAQVQPASFPNLAVGLLIDLRTPTKVAKLELATPTRGMTVQVYGANGAQPPATITTPGWTMLSGSHTLKKKVTHLRLHTAGRPYRYVLVWIVKAPTASQGTPTAPGHVALSELALFPPAS